MQDQDGEIHVETDEARGATNNNIVRWVLLISTLGAIVLLSIVWMTGAATQSDEDQNVSVSRQMNDDANAEAAADSTDSIVGDDADQLETADGDTAAPEATATADADDAAN